MLGVAVAEWLAELDVAVENYAWSTAMCLGRSQLRGWGAKRERGEPASVSGAHLAISLDFPRW